MSDTGKSDTGRATFKRAEVFRVGQLIEQALTPPGPVRGFKPGCSDATVATQAAELLKRPLNAEDIKRVRLQTHGKLATEGRPNTEVVASLLQTVTNQTVALKKLEDRIAAVSAWSLKRKRGAADFGNAPLFVSTVPASVRLPCSLLAS